MLPRDLIAMFTYLCLTKLAYGYTCYRCAYSLESEGSRRECIDDPDSLGRSAYLECNSTSYCVLQEQYDIHKDMVTSYFRSCSGVSWGINSCDRDWSHVTCKHSCQGNFCNTGDRGERYSAYLKSHQDSQYDWNGAATTSVVNLMICVALMISVILTWR